MTKVLFEIIVFTISMFSNAHTEGSFDLMAEGEQPVSWLFQAEASGGYDEYASSQFKLLLPSDDRDREFSVKLIDNALYEIVSTDEDPVVVDTVPYLSTMDWELGFTGRQILYDSESQELQIMPTGESCVVFSPSQKAVLIFKREYFGE